MFKFLRHPLAPEMSAAAFVAMVGAVVGRQAALGMDSQQGIAAAASVAGSILVAIMVRTRPQAGREDAGSRRDA